MQGGSVASNQNGVCFNVTVIIPVYWTAETAKNSIRTIVCKTIQAIIHIAIEYIFSFCFVLGFFVLQKVNLQISLDMESRTALPSQSHRLWPYWCRNGKHRRTLHQLYLCCETRFPLPHPPEHCTETDKTQKAASITAGKSLQSSLCVWYELKLHTFAFRYMV